MAESLVGGAFLSAFLQVLFDRMASREVVNFFGERKFNDQLLKKLKITLLSVNAVLNDAEEKQITNSAVKEWLDELKDAVYNAEDLIDEIATEASKCRFEAQLQTGTSKVWKLLGTSPSSFDKEIELKLQETLDTLQYIVKQKDVLGLREGIAVKPSSRVPSTSLVDESGVYGRDEDKEAIVKFLLSDDAKGNKIGVIAIVGMGGVGKTTLAQLVYNDNRVEEHFELKVWVCVSEDFDVFRVTKTIFEAVASETCQTEDLNLLQVKLKEIWRSKKFLLVLDNVWNENYTNWEVLRSPFQSGAQGSKIIVTTRNENVASIMRTAPIHHLKQLPDEDCWLLFARHAFHNVNSCANPNLEVIGRGIAKKCKGLPLAAKTLGGLLRCKLDPKEWDELLRSDIWDFSDDASNILPALRLSYHYLPSHLKRCFAYCSIFPKDYEFQRQELVLLWMAEDFLRHPKGKKRMEEVGDEYFHDLVSRSFFQQSSGEKSCFVMHDLINDLAKFVSGEFCLRWEGEGSHKFVKTRHLSYLIKEHDVIKKFEAFYEAKCLRTFLLLQSENAVTRSKELPDDLLLRLRCLRVLSLSGYLMTELPDSIGNLKHLRYLDLSHNAFERLPDTVCALFNLQTLLLSGCFCLKELPKNMGRLINLRHLCISGTRLVEMPLQMSNLKDLQTLTNFIIGEHGDSSIRGLRELQHLRGTISISGLQNVGHPGEALEINLKD